MPHLYLQFADPTMPGSNVTHLVTQDPITDAQAQFSATPLAQPGISQILPNGPRYVVIQTPVPMVLPSQSGPPSDFRLINLLVPESNQFVPSWDALHAAFTRLTGVSDFDTALWPTYTP